MKKSFTKFETGYDAGMRTHTSDVWLVVIKGAYERLLLSGSQGWPTRESRGRAADNFL